MASALVSLGARAAPLQRSVTSTASEGGNDNSHARAADKNDCTLLGRGYAEYTNCHPLSVRNSINWAAVPIVESRRYATHVKIYAVLLLD